MVDDHLIWDNNSRLSGGGATLWLVPPGSGKNGGSTQPLGTIALRRALIEGGSRIDSTQTTPLL